MAFLVQDHFQKSIIILLNTALILLTGHYNNMNFIKNILARIFALWALIIFVSTLLIILPAVWIISTQPEPKRTISLFKIFLVWMKVFFVFAGVRRIFRGGEHFKKGENYIVICNHRSFMDVPLSSP